MSKEDKMIELLEELVKWTKAANIPKVKELLLSVLESPEELAAYQFSDGEKSGRDVADQVNVTQPTIGKWWKKWIAAGIAEPVSVQRGDRAKRLFSLEDFGVEVPEIVRASPNPEGGTVSDKQENNAGTP
jgi:DNA-binding MarR family transcriptional regulator